MKILVIGESCRDIFHYGECKRLCPEAPVPVFKSIKTKQNGGMAMNVLNNLTTIQDGNIPTIITNRNWKEIKKTRFVEVNSNHMFLRLDENDSSYGKINLSEYNQEFINTFDAIVISDYNKGFLSEEALKQISLMHPLTFLDTKKILGDWCKNFSFIKINSKEYENTKHILTEQLLKNLIVTKGPKGCFYRDKIYPVSSVEVKDVSGAGDTFIAGLVSKFCETRDIDMSIRYANECATIVVQKKGVSVV